MEPNQCQGQFVSFCFDPRGSHYHPTSLLLLFSGRRSSRSVYPLLLDYRNILKDVKSCSPVLTRYGIQDFTRGTIDALFGQKRTQTYIVEYNDELVRTDSLI